MAKRFNFRKFGVTVLTLILVVSLMCGTMSIGIFASGTESYEIGDYAYSDSKNTTPAGEIPANGEWKYIKMTSAEYDCGKEEHRHSMVCRYWGDCEEHIHSEAGCTVVAPAKAQWQVVENTDSALHLDIHIALNATYILDGVSYSSSVQLDAEDYYNGNLIITSDVPFNITGTEIYDAGQRRFNGDFPVGTSERPVYYTISLVKNVDFNIDGEIISVPMTFSKTVNFWHSDNICETIRQSSSRTRDWKAGKFVYGGMDFKLGASQTVTTPDDPANPPEEPVLTEATVTIQKNVSGVALEENKEYVFGVYTADGNKADTVRLTVQAGGANAIGTTVLSLNETYYVIEEGTPDIDGFTRTTTATIDGNTVDGETSAAFTLEGDTAVVFVNSYVAVPVETEPEVTEPEVTEPEVTEPEVTEPEVTDPEVTEPEVTEPEVTEPEVTEPEVTEPEVTEPEVTEPEVTEPEVTEPEVTEPEVTEPEVTEPEVTEPEVTEPEVTEPEVTEPEVTEPEVTEPEVTEPEVIETEFTIPDTLEPEIIEPIPIETYPEYPKPVETEPVVTEPEPEITEPEFEWPEITRPIETEPEVIEPEITEPEVTEPEVTEPIGDDPAGDDPTTSDDGGDDNDGNDDGDDNGDLVDIGDEEVPLTDIPDEDVPLTGDSITWFAIAALSGIGLLVMRKDKKRKENA